MQHFTVVKCLRNRHKSHNSDTDKSGFETLYNILLRITVKLFFSVPESTDSHCSCKGSNRHTMSKSMCYLGLVGDISGVKGLIRH